MSARRETGETMTAAAFLTWSEQQRDDARHELLDGRIVAMSPERVVHTRTKYAVARQLERAIAEAGLSCEALVDGMAVRVDDATVFEPDALVRCGPRLADDTVLILDPVIVVEVTSPSSQRLDSSTKLTRYFENPSIMHYLIVVTGSRTVLHHRRGEDGAIQTTICSAGSLRLEPPGLCVDVSAFFVAPTDGART